MVIALACRGLPENKQRPGMIIGAVVAVAMRIVLTVAVATLLSTPFLKIVGGSLQVWIAVKLLRGEEHGGNDVEASDRLFHVVKTIAVADVVMSLDNVLAIAAVAKDSTALLTVGLAISIPMIVAAAALIMRLLARFPVLVWAGAGLLGWVAGEMLITDPWLVKTLGEKMVHTLELPTAALAAALVVALGFVLNKMGAAQHEPAERDA